MQEAPQAPLTTCFVAGHSGGHIIPCITLADNLREHEPRQTIIFFTTDASLDRSIMQQHGAIHHVPLPTARRIPYRNPFKWPWFFLGMIRSWWISFTQLRKHKPQRLHTTGGLVALPVCMAAWLLRIPIELHEVNVQPGATIKLLARFADKINITYHETETILQRSCTIAPYPVKYHLHHTQQDPRTARASLGLDQNRFTITILGGSQGSLQLNQLIHAWIHQHPYVHASVQIIHQVGSSQDVNTWNTFYSNYNIPSYCFTFRKHLDYIYCASDYVLSRAGAGTLAELAFFQKKCCIIPLELKNNDHQLHNARAYTKQRANHALLIRGHEIMKLHQHLTKLVVKP
ncbi:UDP-N-acetylglucosamine--N-acetylmuramyl-(pentapeptide) pyrophosphoryl-undecaprenol N-acetylglucosamine transferase [Candidatus Babeliales bacterium]|nr:UDP-N-acetylglucosamine--N-acetylmuramyl-(pentapeptide) pyrophosphoryl-undecaprenol N-acetylglucosamine transferase [Candidatus Babeliales bacterium]